MKFGIYEDYGNFTCAGYPGVIGHLSTGKNKTILYIKSLFILDAINLDILYIDAATFASWDVDYVKLDGCYALPQDMDQGYPEFGRYLNGTGRAMVYSCSWPVYQIYAGMQVSNVVLIKYMRI